MEYFSIFYWSTLGIFIALITVFLPSLFLLKFYMVIREPYARKYYDSEDFEEKPEVLKEMLDELHDYLYRNEEYEQASEIKKIIIKFQQQKLSIPDVFDKVILQTYIVGAGDMHPYPDRNPQTLNTYSDNGDTDTEYGFLNVKIENKFSIKEILKRIFFS